MMLGFVMSLKSRILYSLMLSGKSEFKRTMARYDPAKQSLEEDLIRAQIARKGFERFSRFMSFMSKDPKDVLQERAVRGGVKAVIMTPANPNDKLVLYIHGGAWVLKLEKLHRNFAANIARSTNAKIWVADYRLAPEYPFPAGLNDVFALYQAMLRDGHDPKKIIIMGDSAGGNLTLALLLKIKQEGLPMPGAAIPLSPVTDFHMEAESFTTKAEVDPVLAVDKHKILYFTYLRGASPLDPLVSPLFGDLEGLPPLLIIVGGQEILLNDSINFAEKARKAGVDVTLDVHDELFHVYPLFTDILDDAKIALGKIALFIAMKTA